MGNSSSGKTVVPKKTNDEAQPNNTSQQRSNVRAHLKEQTQTTPSALNSTCVLLKDALPSSQESTSNLPADHVAPSSADNISSPSPAKWKPFDSVSIYSNLMDDRLPGVVVTVDEETEQITGYFWNIHSLHIEYRKYPFDSEELEARIYDSSYDPWQMPMDDQDLSDGQRHQIKSRLSQRLSMKQSVVNTLNATEWLAKFKLFLKEKERLCREGNSFIRLISLFLTENVSEWIDIFARFVTMMIIFGEESANTVAVDRKLGILFNILNVGSEKIDDQSLHVICRMYAKGVIPPVESTASKEEHAERKQSVTEFARKLMLKITSYDDEIDFSEFKALITGNAEMVEMLRHSVTEMVLTDRSKITPRS